ncbi:unnamed protein product [Rhizophagus irregularis]|uniref:Uncharacterized protein n=2 Tax=Rhizophagus irregularis TaxID=588596 RepID=A0A2I1H4S2_9GLOM|nr:hypothetical protein RhiirA4_547903 [Rhizophagus irregularis]CAB4427534.1 unnamed protein product [Rhizophagus irregularis]
MDELTEFNYFIVLITLMIMASVHNLIKSISLYRAHIFKVSSTIKIIFNVCGLACGISNLVVLFTSTAATLSKCLATTYLEMITNFAFSELVMIFLIWKLRQLGKSENHDYIGYGLLLTRSSLHIIHVVLTKPQIIFDPVSSKCEKNANDWKIFLLIATVTDILIDVYVAFRFFLYIRNAKSIHSEQHSLLPSNRLIIWDSLRIFMASIQDISIIVLSHISYPTISYTILSVIFISLSYVITFDVGKSDNPTDEGSLEDDLERTLDDISETSNSSLNIVLRASNGMLADTPLKDVRDIIKMEQQYNIEMLGPNIDVEISQQSLSFYEIVSIIFGED